MNPRQYQRPTPPKQTIWRPPLWKLCGLAVSVLQACAGGQTGGEVDSPLCDEQAQVVEWMATTPLGFSAAEVAGTFGGEDTVSPTWFPPANPDRATFEAPAAGTQLSLKRDLTAGQVAFVRSQRRAASGMETLALPEYDCRDRLELPVRLTLQTATGELDHTLDTKLWVFIRDAARVQARIVADDLRGSLQVQTPENVTADLNVRLDWTPASDVPGGAIDLGTSRVSGETADYMAVPFATF